jgi:hypothetical protein
MGWMRFTAMFWSVIPYKLVKLSTAPSHLTVRMRGLCDDEKIVLSSHDGDSGSKKYRQASVAPAV